MIVDRILQIIDYKVINKNKFYKETGLSNGFLDKVKDIGASKIEQILISYPEINPEWLLMGKGEMLRNEPKESMKEIVQIETKTNNEQYEDRLRDKDKIILGLEREFKMMEAEIVRLKKVESFDSKEPLEVERHSTTRVSK